MPTINVMGEGGGGFFPNVFSGGGGIFFFRLSILQTPPPSPRLINNERSLTLNRLCNNECKQTPKAKVNKYILYISINFWLHVTRSNFKHQSVGLIGPRMSPYKWHCSVCSFHLAWVSNLLFRWYMVHRSNTNIEVEV